MTEHATEKTAEQQTEQIPTLGDLPEPVTKADGQITVDDIASAVQVIDYATGQGAFKGWHDVIAVLSLRNRLWAFVKAYRAQQAAEQTQAAAAEAAEEAAAPAEAGAGSDEGGRRRVGGRVHRREENA